MLTDDLIKRASAIHSGAYSYQISSQDVGVFDHISVKCPAHGVFSQRVSNHLSGRGCPACARERLKGLALEKWKEKARAVHHDAYDYDLVGKATGRVQIRCREHGLFSQSANSHAHGGAGCPKCAARKTSERMAMTAKEWEEKASAVHSGRYRYTGDYHRSSAKVTVICADHGSFRQLAELHLKGHGCPACANVERSREKKLLWSDQVFRERMLAVFEGNFEQRSEASRRMWEDPDFRKRLTELSRVRWEDPAFRAKMATLRQTFKQPVVSSLTSSCCQVLDSLGVKYETEYPVGFWNFDIFIPDHKILIECNGEYWHSLPKAVRNDKAKATYVERYFPGFRLLQIWEVEFFKVGRVEFILRKALELLNGPQRQVAFDQLSVVEIDRQQAASLYSAHHYLGSCRGNTHFGLLHDNELIGACSFGPFQRNEQTKKYKGGVELTRFVIRDDHQAKNLGSWFLSRCLKKTVKPVVTYADSTQGHDGALYKACNFRLSHRVDPDYFYTDSSGFVIHKKTLWSQARKMGMQEADYAVSRGLSKKWGGEKLCFIYE